MNRAWRKKKSSRRISALGAGGLTLALVFGGTVAGTAAIAAPPTGGECEGTSTLLFAGDNEVDWEDVRPISFEIDDEGYLEGLTGGYFWTCVAGGEPGTTQYFENAPIPRTLADEGESFSIEWSSDGEAIDYSFEGVINSDGTAEGLVMANMGVCGASILSWSAATGVTTPEPTFEIDPIAPVSVWDIARGGITVNSSGFEQHDEVTVTINGESQTAEADFFGELSFSYSNPLTAGHYDVTLSTDAGSVSEAFEVIADIDFFDEHTDIPLMFATPEVWTDAEAASVDVFARYLLANTSIDVLLNGRIIDTIATGNFDSVSYTLTETLSVGQHTLELFHPAVSISKTIEVVPSAEGAPAPAVDYVGEATQNIAGTTWTSETNTFPLTFSVDADGNITDFTTEYRWVCWLSPDNPTGIIGLDDMPDSRITSDRAFGIAWEASNLDDISVYGTVSSDGSASGTIFVDTGSCGMAYLEWNAEGDIDLDPVLVEVTAEAPTRDGNTITIPTIEGITYADAAGTTLTGTLTLNEGETLTITATANDGYELTEGTHQWTFEHEATDPDPETRTIPHATPSEDDLDVAFEGAITLPSEAQAGDTITISVTGAQAGDTVGVWLFSTPVYLGTQVVDADGNVTVTIPAETIVGDHKIGVWNGADENLIGWGTLAVVASDTGNDDDGSDSDDQGNGSDDDGDLATTGSAGVGIAGVAALVLLVTGAGVMALRRRVTV